MARPTGVQTNSVQVRFTPREWAAICQAAEVSGWSKQDVIRRATEIGLVRLKRVDYQLGDIIEAGTTWEVINQQAEAKAAEETPPGNKTANGGKK